MSSVVSFDPNLVGVNTDPNLIVGNNNLSITIGGGASYHSAFATSSFLTTGKFYYEFTQTALPNNAYDSIVGLANSSAPLNNYPGQTSASIGLQSSGGTIGSITGTSLSWGAGAVIGIAFDLSAGKIWIRNAGGWQGGNDPATGLGGLTYTVTGGLLPIFCVEAAAKTTVNFGASSYAYTPPTGFGNVQGAPAIEKSGKLVSYTVLVPQSMKCGKVVVYAVLNPTVVVAQDPMLIMMM